MIITIYTYVPTNKGSVVKSVYVTYDIFIILTLLSNINNAAFFIKGVYVRPSVFLVLSARLPLHGFS